MKAKAASEYILSNQREVLAFLKTQFPLYHLSNFFFRDLQYGIQVMLDRKKGWKVGYKEAEQIAILFAAQLERAKIFTRIDQQSWAVNYPEFKTPPAKPATAAAKPAAPAPAAPGAARQGTPAMAPRAAVPVAPRPAATPANPASPNTGGGGETGTSGKDPSPEHQRQ